MTPDSTVTTVVSSELIEMVKLIGGIVSIAGGTVAILVVVITRLVPWLLDNSKKHLLEKRLDADLYPPGVLEQATRSSHSRAKRTWSGRKPRGWATSTKSGLLTTRRGNGRTRSR